jgi:hypothetical protein
MNLQTQKIELAKMLFSIEDKKVMKRVTTFFETEVNQNRLTKEAYNLAIDDAKKNIKAGKFTTHENVLKAATKW